MAREDQRAELRAVLADLERTLSHIVESGNQALSVAPAAEGLFAQSDGGPPSAYSNDGEQGLDAPDGPPRPDPALPGAPPAAAGSTRPASAYATLEALQFAYHACMACRLGATRNRLVFGTGASRPRILFIGEGPGAEEDAQGLPFVGRAGALLTGFITALGLTREDVYITNVVKCRPPGNRTPEPDEVATCHPILARQIELLDPQLIVTLGNVPLKALNARAGGITKERGRVFTYQQWKVLPTFHPSYLLRNSRDILLCWADFRQAFEESYPVA